MVARDRDCVTSRQYGLGTHERSFAIDIRKRIGLIFDNKLQFGAAPNIFVDEAGFSVGGMLFVAFESSSTYQERLE